jgi:chemotaxis response regulator CheB
MIYDDAEIIQDSTETGDIVIGKSRMPRKVISEMIEKQKKLKISRKQFIRKNDELAGEDDQDDDFASYYNPDLIGDSNLQ